MPSKYNNVLLSGVKLDNEDNSRSPHRKSDKRYKIRFNDNIVDNENGQSAFILQHVSKMRSS